MLIFVRNHSNATFMAFRASEFADLDVEVLFVLSGSKLLISRPMHINQFDYDLPQECIAQQALDKRSDSRLLYTGAVTDAFEDYRFFQLPELLQSGDLLIFNDSRVIPARLFGKKETGGRVEVLLERIVDQALVLCQIRASKSPKPGSRIIFTPSVSADVAGRDGDLFELQFNLSGSLSAFLAEHGHMPLPPYIDRADDDVDKERYQTVYARQPGAVAAPTAGLHFDQALLKQLTDNGVETGFVTLHVGAGTFQPVRDDDIAKHKMHAEWLEVSEAICEKIYVARQHGNKVIAVGTTVVRSLETACQSGELQPYRGDTSIFIRPGYRFNSVDALLTNFHLPRSTLLMLVCAFGGYEKMMRAYRYAVQQQYRFYSYGDAMYIERNHAV